jgi:hypothetical protein
MENLNELYKGTIYSHYAQISLVDKEDTDSDPLMRSGSESVTFGPLGVTVAAEDDKDIEVFVFQGKGEPEHKLCVTGQIMVGNQGLLLGNIAEEVVVDWPKGRTLVTVYTNGIDIETTKIYFCLEYLGEH